MSFTVRDRQARYAALGYNPGPIDGMMGPQTRKAEAAAMEAREVATWRELFHISGLHRVHWHWTAGAEGIIKLERKHYNGLVDSEGNRHDGDWAPLYQAEYRAGRIGASHTLNANSGSIGIACDAMAGAKERPLDWGSNPLTWPQLWEMCEWTAEWCWEFDIPVSKYSTLSHAEIQPTLGIRQRFKWDISCLPGDMKVSVPIMVGDRLRDMTREKLQDVRAAA